MASDVRAQMVEGAAMLLARRGVQATSFGEVIKATGAPRGSIYHHFPRGKSQLVEEAMDLLATRAFDSMERHAGASARRITEEFLAMWRGFVGDFEQRGGCAILAVSVTADSDHLVDHAAAIFRRWRSRLAELLHQGGLTPLQAKGFATTLVAVVEGVVAMARAERSMEPFDLASQQMIDHVRRLTETPRTP